MNRNKKGIEGKVWSENGRRERVNYAGRKQGKDEITKGGVDGEWKGKTEEGNKK